MVNELLDLSRIESGTTQLLLDDVDLIRLGSGHDRTAPGSSPNDRSADRTGPADSVSPVRGDEDRLGQS